MSYDFDSFIDRHNTSSLKFDFAKERGRPEDVLSYWVADMDFPTAPEIIAAVTARAQNGIYGYTDVKEPYFAAVQSWYRNRFGYTVQREWLTVTPGVVFAVALAIQAFTKKGDAVLIQNPVYYPFSETVVAADRVLVSEPLVWHNGRYEIDFSAFESAVVKNNVRLFLLCNPHNPGGRSWTRTELETIGRICLRHNVIVVSDEIHSDFVWSPCTHTMFASISPELEAITVTCTSPSKTFNLAGLQVSNIFVANPSLNAAYRNALDAFGYSQPPLMGLTACEAAYTNGTEWLSAAKAYIEANIERTVSYLNTNEPRIRAYKPEATYLVWIDCHGLGVTDHELNHAITNNAKVWLDAGRIFGKEGECFERINVCTSWAYLESGLSRLVAEFKKLG